MVSSLFLGQLLAAAALAAPTASAKAGTAAADCKSPPLGFYYTTEYSQQVMKINPGDADGVFVGEFIEGDFPDASQVHANGTFGGPPTNLFYQDKATGDRYGAVFTHIDPSSTAQAVDIRFVKGRPGDAVFYLNQDGTFYASPLSGGDKTLFACDATNKAGEKVSRFRYGFADSQGNPPTGCTYPEKSWRAYDYNQDGQDPDDCINDL